MKKIGILTFHYVDNYGAVLQAYALRKKINTFENYDAEIINYVPSDFQYLLYENNEEARKLLIKKRKLFENFLQLNCNMNSPIVSEVMGNQFDYYCVGSDQVWNMSFSTEEYFFPNLKKKDNCFSYAASIGMSVQDALNYKELFIKHIPKFKSISVREQEHVQFIKGLCEVDCSCVLDPTLLLKKEEYYPLILRKEKIKEPFIFFFWLRHDKNIIQGIEFVNMVSRKYNLQIIHSMYDAKKYTFNLNAGCMIYEGVEDFLWYIKNARFVITNSYHATLFSLQFKTPFYVFVAKSMRSRIDLLKDKFLIKNRVIEKYVSANNIDSNIDFDEIERKLKAEREMSIKYLRRALDVDEEMKNE